ncbi:L-threonine O-3-phosphate decarboxylase [Sulfuritortus calidifontis]|uniref:threonine-phosphate decarboxylase n=1 Tax=Sulfuritortus calidifontis TaxID=1914471 RepID=A0A4R3JYP7_9PROT|nr:threonine-phosphate decarboxylase CobD [Sulfuritortus calidifontis]TCS73943.1 L-threonine O-3-phosphate decarboxylase [Sulfuritortus calidifontis]
MLEHGGRLQRAAQQYGIPLGDWLDLSTGINPQAWPVPPIPDSVWSRLPEEEDGLTQAACDYYGSAHVLPVAGSQAAIQALPHLRPRGRVGVISPGYAEHAHAWRVAGHNVMPLPHESPGRAIGACDVVVLIQPNNPTGTRLPKEALLAWHAELSARGGWLVVDEAFMDATPEASLAAFTDRPGLIVLRSLGKFFGLAGARVGFVLARPDLLQRLAERLGPWPVANASRYIARQALRDTAWQQATRPRLQAASRRLAELLRENGLAAEGGCALFQWLRTESAHDIHKRLARRGILTRCFEEPASLRFGLPGSEAEWARLASALSELKA